MSSPRVSLVLDAARTVFNTARKRRVPADMVILSTGLEPQPDATEVSRLFGVGWSSNGFIIARHFGKH